MTRLVSKDEIKKIADELGMKVRIDSENPGVLNTTTGEIRSLTSYFDEIFAKDTFYMSEKDIGLKNIGAKRIEANRLNYHNTPSARSFDLKDQIA